MMLRICFHKCEIPRLTAEMVAEPSLGPKTVPREPTEDTTQVIQYGMEAHLLEHYNNTPNIPPINSKINPKGNWEKMNSESIFFIKLDKQ